MRILHSHDSTNGGGSDRKNPEACTIVIFGASGDLTSRKLIPALYQLFKEKQIAAIVPRGWFCAPRENRRLVAAGIAHRHLDQFSRTKPVDDKIWATFARKHFLLPGRFDR